MRPLLLQGSNYCYYCPTYCSLLLPCTLLLPCILLPCMLLPCVLLLPCTLLLPHVLLLPYTLLLACTLLPLLPHIPPLSVAATRLIANGKQPAGRFSDSAGRVDPGKKSAVGAVDSTQAVTKS